MPTLTREELYELVWKDPVRTVAATFGVSDVWLKKVCAGANVPVPERGYWAKLQAGKPVMRARLPLRDPGMSDRVSISKAHQSWRWDPGAELAEPLPDLPVFDEPIEAVRARVVKRVGKVAAIRALEAPWGAIRKLLDEDERRRAKQAEHTWSSSWYAPRFDSPFERRRLRLLNSLALAFARSGAKLELRGKEARELTVHVGTQHLSFTLDHPSAKPTIHGEWATRPGPVDILKLELKSKFPEAGVAGLWTDGDGSKLEERLTDIVVDIIVAGEAQYRAGQFSHHAWLIKRRAENEAELVRRREEAERRRREQELKEQQERRDLLFRQARDWRTAQDIRAFVSDVLSESGGGDRDAGLAEWRAWALAEADEIDPVKRGLELGRTDSDAADDDERRCECGMERACDCDCEA
ncbi:hypothetical protein [Phenylobacterium sp.]|uniref:hypothetical protein n=1 Tax=Phenylobacterium sp. TaxID=1871053 RepID=UPI002FC6D5AA